MTTLMRRPFSTGLDDFTNTFRLFDEIMNRAFNEPAGLRPWVPAVDIAETENDLVLTADIPGLKLEDIDIRLENGTLTISGERKFEGDEKHGAWHRVERSYGSFQRAFSLPDSVDIDKVEASYQNGVLQVVLPKKEMAKPKQIKVSVSNN
jgi:HSP20 family protein